MDSENKEGMYFDDGGEYRIYSPVCDKLAIDGFYNNRLKSQTHMKNFRRRHQLKTQILQLHVPDEVNVFNYNHML